MNVKRIFRIIIILLLVCGCNKQSESLKYNDSISTEDIDGYSRDMHINNDTLFVVNEDEGLLIYNIDTSNQSVKLHLIYSDSTYYQNKGWNLSGIQYINSLKSIIILDKFYSIQNVEIDLLLENTNINYSKVCCKDDFQHPSKMSVNHLEGKLDIFTLIRNKSWSEGIPTNIVTIYKIQMIKIADLIIADEPIKIIDSLIYDVNDIHYANNRLFVSHTNYNKPEFRIYNSDNYNENFSLDTVMTTPAIPNALYSDGETLFVGMDDHGGVKVYNVGNADSITEIGWIATGFSVKEIYWDPSSRLLLLSCGYQGVVVIALDESMQEVETWVINTSYAYAARNYMGNIIVATRKGLEIITLNNNQ